MIRAPAASVTEVEGGPGTGKTAVALHRAAYLLYQDRRRYAGGILVVSPDAAAGRVHRGRAALARRGGPGRRSARSARLVDGAEADDVRRAGRGPRSRAPCRMLKVLRKAARGGAGAPARRRRRSARLAASGRALRARPPAAVVAFGRRLERTSCDRIRQHVLGGTAPVNLLRPRARKLLLDALWAQVRRGRPPHGPGAGRRAARRASTRTSPPRTPSSPSSTPGGPS